MFFLFYSSACARVDYKCTVLVIIIEININTVPAITGNCCHTAGIDNFTISYTIRFILA